MGSRNLLHQTWTPPEQSVTPTDKLMYNTYDVLVSRSMVITPQYAELLGVPANENPDIESVARHGMIRSTLNAPRLAEVKAIGGEPFFCDVKLTVRLYKDLCEYLMAFREAYHRDAIVLEANDRMMDNILKLENLAEWVYAIALPYFPKEDMVSANSMAGRLGRGRFTRNTFTGKKEEKSIPNVNVVTVGIPDDAPVHGRITDGVLEQAFVEKQRRSNGRTSGWS